jgi:hypothetical protein
MTGRGTNEPGSTAGSAAGSGGPRGDGVNGLRPGEARGGTADVTEGGGARAAGATERGGARAAGGRGGMAVRWAAGAVGLTAIGTGVWILLTDPFIHRPLYVVWWLAGAVALHDGVLVPVTLAVGALLRPRGAPRAGLVAAACVTAIALPVLLAPHSPNPTVHPLDYPRDLLIALGGIAVVTALASAWRGPRSRGGDRSSGEGGGVGRGEGRADGGGGGRGRGRTARGDRGARAGGSDGEGAPGEH